MINKFHRLIAINLFLSLSPLFYSGVVRSGSVRVDSPDPYSYKDETVDQLRIRGSYGRYLHFIGRSPVSYSGLYLPGNPGTMNCSGSYGYTNCYRTGYVAPTYRAPRTEHSEWSYQLDCYEETFDRRGDEYNWMGINNDPVAKAVYDKYCPRINTLRKVYYNKKDKKYYYDNSSSGSSLRNSNSSNNKRTNYYNLAYSKAEKGDYQGAIRDYTKAIKIKPDDANAYYSRGYAKFYLKDNKGAINDFTKAIKLKPRYTIAYYSRGSAKNNLKDYTGAIKDLTKVIKLKPDYADAYLNRGNAKFYLKDNKGAIKDYTKVIKIKPDYASAYGNRGNVKELIDDLKGACADWRKASRLDGKSRPWIQKQCD